MAYVFTQPYYSASDDSTITGLLDHPTYGVIPFTASPTDTTAYGPVIYADAEAGEFGPVVSYADSHWYSTVTDEDYEIGDLVLSPTGVQPANSTQLVPPTPAEGQTLQWSGSAWVLASFDITLPLAAAKTSLIESVDSNYASAVNYQTSLYSNLQLIAAPDVNALDTKSYPGTTVGEYLTYADGLVSSATSDINSAEGTANLYSFNPADIPFTPAVSGVINTSRTGLDFNPSTYTTFISTTLTPAETELYIPATSTVLTYGQFIPGQFDSPGNCFTTGNYTVLIRQVSTGFVLAEFTPPEGSNVDVAF